MKKYRVWISIEETEVDDGGDAYGEADTIGLPDPVTDHVDTLAKAQAVVVAVLQAHNPSEVRFSDHGGLYRRAPKTE